MISFQLVSVTTVGVRERNRSGILVGRPGLDPGTLRVFQIVQGRPSASRSDDPDEVRCPPTSTEVLSRLTSWLDSWLDLGSFQGQVNI